MKITNFHYSNMKMPDPSPSEYPKWVYMDGYPGVLADDAAQEAELLARSVKAKTDKPIIIPQAKAPEVTPDPPKNILSGPNDEKEMLLKIAKEKGVAVDGRWKIDRIRATLEKAIP